MSALSIQPTFPIFTESDGLPLEAGYIWIGTANLDPQGNPIAVYWDSALTIAAAQPIRTLNGYPSRNGTPARMYVNSDYSIRVQNSKGSMVYSAPEALERYSSDLISFTGFKGQVGVIADLANDDGSDWIGFTQAGSGSAPRSAQEKMRDTVSVKDFGAIGDGINDDTAAIQAAIDAGYVAYLPAGIYKVTSEIVIKDGTGLVGVSAFWARRTAYTYAGSHTSVLKYAGAGGANSCVVRVSKKAVGVFGTDFSGPDTDDLKNYYLENVHVDANQLAEYAWYFYRAGNSGVIANNLTAEKAAKDNFLFLGMFASYLGTFGAYTAVGRGIVVAEDVFNWAGSGSSEFNCYNFNATFIAANNGTSNTFVEYTAFVTDTAADEYNCGIYINAGRGSKFNLSSEGNFGRSAIITGQSSGGGPLYCTFDYFEGNGAGPKVKGYGRFSNGLTLANGFLFPVTQSGTIKAETIKIYPNTLNDGPGFSNDWLVLDRLTGTSGYVAFNVNSNTNRFRVTNSAGTIQYITQRPTPVGVFNTGYFKGDATLSDTRFLRGDNIVNNFYGDGATVNFTLAYAPANQNQASVFVNGVLQTVVTNYTISGTTLTFVTAPASGAVIVVSYSNMTLTRTSAGLYQVTFHVAQPDANYSVTLSTVQNDGQTTAAVFALTTTGFEIRTTTVTAPTVLADTGDFVSFMVARNGS